MATSQKVVIIPAKDLKKQADTTESKYQQKIVDLESRNRELEQNLNTTEELLAQAKQKVKQTETRIKLITGLNISPPKQLSGSTDSLQADNNKISPCDSLVTVVGDYILENNEKDSLYDEQITTMDSLSRNKDSVIQTSAESYNSLHRLFDQSLDQQQSLQKQNLQLQKQVNRQRLKSKLVTIGLLFLSGTATNYLLHH